MKLWILRVILTLAAMAMPSVASAHLATFGSWEITEQHLRTLFPTATKFLAKSVSYTPEQVASIEAELGFKLYPEDVNPTFYIAVKQEQGKQRFLGVTLFIDPRVQPKMLDGAVVQLEVGIAVDNKGAISGVRVFDYRGNLALTRPAFLNQFNGMTLNDDFRVGAKIKAVDGEAEESQLVANAAREALYLMKISLGKKKN